MIIEKLLIGLLLVVGIYIGIRILSYGVFRSYFEAMNQKTKKDK